MDRRKRRVVLGWAIVAMMLAAVMSSAGQEKTVFGGMADFPPLSYEENGTVEGFFSDVFLEAAKRAGFDVALELYPVSRLYVYLKNGELDGNTATTRRPDRDEYLLFSVTPVMRSRVHVFVKRGREFPFATVDDLKGKRVGLLLGWETENVELERAIDDGTLLAERVPGLDQNLKKLMADRVDCVISTEQLTWYFASELGIAEQLVALNPPVSEITVFFSVSKRTKRIPDPQEYLRKLSAALDEMVRDGTYKSLQRKYNVVSRESG